jgi:nucleotide-binding universal stress UspA family protein
MTQQLITRILVATDFSACADRALDYAAFLARAWAAPLEILHVVEVPPDMDQEDAVSGSFFEQRRKAAEQPLERLVASLASHGVAATWQQRFGIPSQQLNAAAGELHADLIVVGTHGRTGLAHILLGSTAERAVRGAPCPVLTVRALPARREAAEAQAAAPPLAFHRVLCPVDFSRCSVDALEYAAQVAYGFGAALTILHVLEPVFFDLELGLGKVPDYDRAKTEAESRLAAVRDALTQQGLTVETVVSGGVRADSILAAAQPDRCDVIVMGTHGRRGLPALVTGSIAEAVLRRAAAPVLTIRHSVAPAGAHMIPREIAVELGV